MYIPAHRAMVAWAPEVGSITESPDGIQLATFPTVPSSFTAIGYTDVPAAEENFNNGMGYGIGSSRALYTQKGAVNPQVQFDLKLGSTSFLANCFRNGSDVLPWITLFVGVNSVYTEVYRYCKCSKIDFDFPEQTQAPAPIKASVTFEALGVQFLATPLAVSASTLRALGRPLFWHDLRSFKLTDGTGTETNRRKDLMGFKVSLDHKLERKGGMEDFGDDVPTSRINYDILEHEQVVSGELSLHSRLAPTLFHGQKSSQTWGPLVVPVSNVPALDTGGRGFTLQVDTLVPQTRKQNAVQAGQQMTFSVPFIGDGMGLVLT